MSAYDRQFGEKAVRLPDETGVDKAAERPGAPSSFRLLESFRIHYVILSCSISGQRYPPLPG